MANNRRELVLIQVTCLSLCSPGKVAYPAYKISIDWTFLTFGYISDFPCALFIPLLTRVTQQCVVGSSHPASTS